MKEFGPLGRSSRPLGSVNVKCTSETLSDVKTFSLGVIVS